MKHFSLFSLLFTASALVCFNSQGLASIIQSTSRLAGFSVDSSHYIYLESARHPTTQVPTAKIQIINLETNSCVRNGCLQTDYDNSSSNLTNKNAEDDLINKTIRIIRELRLNQLKVGIRLPMIARSVDPDGIEKFKFFIDHQTKPIEISLEQKYIPSILSGGTSDIDRASMQLVINYNYRKLTLGKLEQYRDAVRKYAIKEVRLSPNRRYVVVLIDLYQATYNASLKTTLVQTFPL
ncbi:MAG: DUF2259 domain-containing protein [Symploca sp. SIO3C6]|nr:DUF2259 domain-containing protein [Symploca sp. SIO3C6]